MQPFSVLGNPGPQSQPRVCPAEQLQLRPPSPPKVWTHWEPEDTEKGEKQNNMKHLSLIKELFTLLSVPAALCFFTEVFETIHENQSNVSISCKSTHIAIAYPEKSQVLKGEELFADYSYSENISWPWYRCIPHH